MKRKHAVLAEIAAVRTEKLIESVEQFHSDCIAADSPAAQDATKRLHDLRWQKICSDYQEAVLKAQREKWT